MSLRSSASECGNPPQGRRGDDTHTCIEKYPPTNVKRTFYPIQMRKTARAVNTRVTPTATSATRRRLR